MDNNVSYPPAPAQQYLRGYTTPSRYRKTYRHVARPHGQTPLRAHATRRRRHTSRASHVARAQQVPPPTPSGRRRATHILEIGEGRVEILEHLMSGLSSPQCEAAFAAFYPRHAPTLLLPLCLTSIQQCASLRPPCFPCAHAPLLTLCLRPPCCPSASPLSPTPPPDPPHAPHLPHLCTAVRCIPPPCPTLLPPLCLMFVRQCAATCPPSALCPKYMSFAPRRPRRGPPLLPSAASMAPLLRLLRQRGGC
jgi:hypothetical protein